MKSLLKTIFIFFAFIFTLSILPQSVIDSDSHSTNYIQNNSQKVVLVSNTVRTGEIYTEENNNYSNGSLNNPTLSYIVFTPKIFTKNSTRYNRESIHNLSANFENEINIRAP